MGGSHPYLAPSNNGATLTADLPLVAAQTTAVGREVHRLPVWNGRAYPLCGDLTGNTGPIPVVSVDFDDPATVIHEATLTTEELWALRVFDGTAYLPFVDPQGGTGNPENGQYAYADTPGTWTTVVNVTPVPEHIFDIAKTPDGLFLAGSAGGVAKIWQSTDNAATWTVPLSVDPVNGEARFYSLMSDGTDLLTVLEDVGTLGTYQTYHRPAGGPWVAVGDPETSDFGDGSVLGVSDWVPFTFNDTPFFLSLSPGKQQGGVQPGWLRARTLPAHDAQRAAIQASLPIYAFHDIARTSDGSTVYALRVDMTVWRGDTAGNWTQVLALANNGKLTSIALDEANGWLYFGSIDSQVLRHTIPA